MEEIDKVLMTPKEYMNLPINGVVGNLDMDNMVSPYVPGKIYRMRGFKPEHGKSAPIIEVGEIDGISELKVKRCLIWA